MQKVKVDFEGANQILPEKIPIRVTTGGAISINSLGPIIFGTCPVLIFSVFEGESEKATLQGHY